MQHILAGSSNRAPCLRLTFPLSALKLTDRVAAICLAVTVAYVFVPSAIQYVMVGLMYSGMPLYTAAIAESIVEYLLIVTTPLIVTALCVSVTCASLVRRARARRHLLAAASSNEQSIFSNEELRNTIAIFLIGLSELVIRSAFALSMAIVAAYSALTTFFTGNVFVFTAVAKVYRVSGALELLFDVLNMLTYCDKFFFSSTASRRSANRSCSRCLVSQSVSYFFLSGIQDTRHLLKAPAQ